MNNPLYPNSYSALTANGGAAYLASPWQFLSNLVSELPNLQKGTGPALASEQLGNTNPNTGENFLQNQITNPANGQVITISGPSSLGQASSTFLISDLVANKTQTTTTNITVDFDNWKRPDRSNPIPRSLRTHVVAP